MEEKKLAVIALGGNAILRGNQKGTVEEQNQNIRETLENLIYLVREGYNLIITHGNNFSAPKSAPNPASVIA